MKCEIIRDLLPVYCDRICSEETAKEVEAHTASCENCKRLLDEYSSEIKSPRRKPEKPFRRIKQKIFRSRLAVAILTAALAVILIVTGYLAYGQAVRRPEQPSFDTVITSVKAKKIAEKLCEGDIDYVMDNIDIYQTSAKLYDQQEEITEHCRRVLTDFQKKYLADRELTVKSDPNIGYAQFVYSNTASASAVIQIYDGDTDILSFLAVNSSKGKFYIFFLSWCGDISRDGSDCTDDIDTLHLALNPTEPTTDDVIKANLINITPTVQGSYSSFAASFARTNEDREKLYDNLLELTKNMLCEQAYYTDFRFDAENSRYLVDIGLIFSEKNGGGRASFTTTLKLRAPGSCFEILPEFEPQIIDGGISDENYDKLKHLFDI